MEAVDLCAHANIVSQAAQSAVRNACESYSQKQGTPGWLKIKSQPYLVENKEGAIKAAAAQKKLVTSLKKFKEGFDEGQPFRLLDAPDGHRLRAVQRTGTFVVASQELHAGDVIAVYAGELCTLQEVLGRDSSAHQWYQADIVLPTGDRLVVDATYHRSDIAEVCDVRVLSRLAPGDSVSQCNSSSLRYALNSPAGVAGQEPSNGLHAPSMLSNRCRNSVDDDSVSACPVLPSTVQVMHNVCQAADLLGSKPLCQGFKPQSPARPACAGLCLPGSLSQPQGILDPSHDIVIGSYRQPQGTRDSSHFTVAGSPPAGSRNYFQDPTAKPQQEGNALAEVEARQNPGPACNSDKLCSMAMDSPAQQRQGTPTATGAASNPINHHSSPWATGRQHRVAATATNMQQQQLQEQHPELQQYEQRCLRRFVIKEKLVANTALIGVLDLEQQELLLLVVAITDIRAGEELMLDYGDEYWQQRLVQLNGESLAEQERVRLAAERDEARQELMAMKASMKAGFTAMVEEIARLRQQLQQKAADNLLAVPSDHHDRQPCAGQQQQVDSQHVAQQQQQRTTQPAHSQQPTVPMPVETADAAACDTSCAPHKHSQRALRETDTAATAQHISSLQQLETFCPMQQAQQQQQYSCRRMQQMAQGRVDQASARAAEAAAAENNDDLQQPQELHVKQQKPQQQQPKRRRLQQTGQVVSNQATAAIAAAAQEDDSVMQLHDQPGPQAAQQQSKRKRLRRLDQLRVASTTAAAAATTTAEDHSSLQQLQGVQVVPPQPHKCSRSRPLAHPPAGDTWAAIGSEQLQVCVDTAVNRDQIKPAGPAAQAFAAVPQPVSSSADPKQRLISSKHMLAAQQLARRLPQQVAVAKPSLLQEPAAGTRAAAGRVVFLDAVVQLPAAGAASDQHQARPRVAAQAAGAVKKRRLRSAATVGATSAAAGNVKASLLHHASGTVAPGAHRPRASAMTAAAAKGSSQGRLSPSDQQQQQQGKQAPTVIDLTVDLPEPVHKASSKQQHRPGPTCQQAQASVIVLDDEPEADAAAALSPTAPFKPKQQTPRLQLLHLRRQRQQQRRLLLSQEAKEELVRAAAADHGVLATVLDRPDWDNVMSALEQHKQQRQICEATNGRPQMRVCRVGCCLEPEDGSWP